MSEHFGSHRQSRWCFGRSRASTQRCNASHEPSCEKRTSCQTQPQRRVIFSKQKRKEGEGPQEELGKIVFSEVTVVNKRSAKKHQVFQSIKNTLNSTPYDRICQCVQQYANSIGQSVCSSSSTQDRSDVCHGWTKRPFQTACTVSYAEKGQSVLINCCKTFSSNIHRTCSAASSKYISPIEQWFLSIYGRTWTGELILTSHQRNKWRKFQKVEEYKSFFRVRLRSHRDIFPVCSCSTDITI